MFDSFGRYVVQNYGFILYNTTLAPTAASYTVKIAMARDRVQLFVDGALKGTVYRGDAVFTATVNAGSEVQ